MVRPSGTEPKIKFYYFVKRVNKEAAQDVLDKVSQEISKVVESI